jgi:oxygen-independent coproporphyrinogen-3 oxidase
VRTSLYVHVPFCVVKCGYCDFNSYEVEDRGVMDRFLLALDAELRLARAPRRPYTVFIGGGTPTFLDPPRFARLLELLREHLDLDQVREVTIEANPESLTVEKAKLARAAGVRRASVGAQSFDAERLRFLDRAHDAAAIRRAVEALREAGFDNISLDLMFGLPGQTLADWDRDLDRALELEPDHLSCYHLTFEPGTRLTRELRQGRIAPNDEDEDRAMFHHTRARLGAAGFVAYEVSNFAGRGGPSLHNDHYWLQGDYLGVGPGAASHRAGWRGTNLKPLEAWASAVERGLPATGEAEYLSPRQRLGEALWLGIRRAAGVDLEALRRRLGLDPRVLHAAAIEAQRIAGLVEVEGEVLRLTAEGLPFGDEVGTSYLGS